MWALYQFDWTSKDKTKVRKDQNGKVGNVHFVVEKIFPFANKNVILVVDHEVFVKKITQKIFNQI